MTLRKWRTPSGNVLLGRNLLEQLLDQRHQLADAVRTSLRAAQNLDSNYVLYQPLRFCRPNRFSQVVRNPPPRLFPSTSISIQATLDGPA